MASLSRIAVTRTASSLASMKVHVALSEALAWPLQVQLQGCFGSQGTHIVFEVNLVALFMRSTKLHMTVFLRANMLDAGSPVQTNGCKEEGHNEHLDVQLAKPCKVLATVTHTVSLN